LRCGVLCAAAHLAARREGDHLAQAPQARRLQRCHMRRRAPVGGAGEAGARSEGCRSRRACAQPAGGASLGSAAQQALHAGRPPRSASRAPRSACRAPCRSSARRRPSAAALARLAMRSRGLGTASTSPCLRRSAASDTFWSALSACSAARAARHVCEGLGACKTAGVWKKRTQGAGRPAERPCQAAWPLRLHMLPHRRASEPLPLPAF
jgi:hypothetical protein